jgi:hypothetical protein
MIETLPVRTPRSAPHATLLPDALECAAQPQANGLPVVHGTLRAHAPRRLNMLLRIHNRAGIPVIEGRCEVAEGEWRIAFDRLRALGIEAYAHVSEAEQANVQRRIWERAVYGTLTVETNGTPQ